MSRKVVIIIENNGKKKMGRPTSDPKRHETRIRMTDEDVRILEFCASKTGTTKTEVIRQGIREVYSKIVQK